MRKKTATIAAKGVNFVVAVAAGGILSFDTVKATDGVEEGD